MPGQIDCCTNLTLHFFTVFCERRPSLPSSIPESLPTFPWKTGRKLPINLADILVELDVIHLPPDVCFAVMEPHSPKSGHNRFLFHSHFAAHRKPLLLCAFKACVPSLTSRAVAFFRLLRRLLVSEFRRSQSCKHVDSLALIIAYFRKG